jgi:hypothetical protein
MYGFCQVAKRQEGAVNSSVLSGRSGKGSLTGDEKLEHEARRANPTEHLTPPCSFVSVAESSYSILKRRTPWI